MHIFCEMPTSHIVQISGNLTVKFIKKDQAARKHFRPRVAYFFPPPWEIQCVNADAVGKNRLGKIRHGNFYLEDAAGTKNFRGLFDFLWEMSPTSKEWERELNKVSAKRIEGREEDTGEAARA